KPELPSAAATRSRPSFTAPCGSPTVVNVGRPLEMSSSTSTANASTPRTEADLIRASIPEAHRDPPGSRHRILPGGAIKTRRRESLLALPPCWSHCQTLDYLE